MKTNRLTNAFCAFITMTLLITAGQLFAQTRHFATTLVSSANATTTASATDTDATTAARLTSTRALLPVPSYTESSIELEFPTAVAANVPAYIKIDASQANLLQGLIGGSIGNIVAGIAGTVLGAQGITVEAKNGTTSAFSASSNFGQPRLRIIRDNAVTAGYYIMITPDVSYNRIKITNTITGGLAVTRTLDVYGAFYVTGGTASCQNGTYTSYSASAGITSLLGSGVTNTRNAIDTNAETFSRISLGTLAAGTYVEQTVYFDGPANNTDKYNVKLKLDPSLLSLNVNVILAGVRI